MKKFLTIAAGIIAVASSHVFSAEPDVTIQVEAIGGGTVSSSPEGIDCPGECTATFPASTSVTLIATPDPEQAIVEWGGACVGMESSCTVTVQEGMNASITFTEQP